MAPPKDIARSYPKRGLTADVGFRSEPKFCGEGSAYFDADYATATLSTTPGSSFSYGLWMNVSDFVPNNQSVLIEIGASGSAGAQVTITLTSTGQIQIFNGSAFIGTTAANTLSLNTWHFIVVAVDGSSGGLKIYVDGVDVTGSHTATFNVTDKTMTVGAFGTPSVYYTEGNLANVFYCTEILTQDQVRKIMRFSSSAQFATITGIESFYPLSADFNDAIGSANLTNNGATLQPKKPQLPRGLDLARGAAMARVYTGRCVDFDGSTDFLNMGTGVDKNYTTRSDRASFSCWFNADQISAAAFIYQNRTQVVTDRPECETQLFTHPSLGLAFDGEGASILIPTTAFNVGQWHHFVGIADDTDGPVKAYLDGVLYDTTSGPQAGANGSNFLIGGRNSSPIIQLFNGKLSNFKIFNVELTQAQVRELYHNPEMAIPTGVSASNLRRHYPLCAYNDTGGMGGRYEIDQGVEGVNGEYGGSPVMNFAQPVPCPQLGLQQSASRIYWDDNTAEKLSATIPALGTDFTIAFWWFSGSSANSDVFFEVNTPGTYQFYDDGSQIAYYSSTAGTFYTGVPVPEGEWSHLGFTQNGVYKNGVLYTTTFSLDWLGTAYRIFGRHSAALACNGTCSNMAFWSDALTTAEMLELYNQGPDYDPRNDTGNYASSDTLQNLWFMDDLTTIKDRKGSNDLTVIGSPIMQSFPENASGSTIVGDFSMKRKGVSVLNAPGSGRATLAANSSLLPATGGGYTLCAFVRLQSTDDDAAVIMSTSTGTNEWGTFYEGSTNKYKIVLSNGTTNISDRPFSGTVTDSEWHHIAWTIQLDATTANGETYIDGASDLSFTRSSFNTPPTPSDFGVGYDPGNSNKQANAAIACLRIYQSVLSANEIKQVYSSDLRLIKGLENE